MSIFWQVYFSMMNVFASNNTTTIATTTTTAAPFLPQYVGYIACVVAVIFFGSNYIPVKKFETGDGRLKL